MVHSPVDRNRLWSRLNDAVAKQGNRRVFERARTEASGIR